LESSVSQILRSLSDEDWTRLIKELGRYAISKSRRLSWRTENTLELPGGETVDSIVSKALKMVLTGAFDDAADSKDIHAGVRRWDPQKNPNFKKYLMDVIKSLLNHLAMSEENTKFTRLPDELPNNGLSWETGLNDGAGNSSWLATPALNPEQILLKKETQNLSDRALEMLVEKSGSDPCLMTVIASMRSGHGAPREISRDTGLSVSAVYGAMKRLDRKAAIIRRELAASGHMQLAE
jgi:hypothetical protein